MTPDEIRQIENFVLAKPLSLISHPENLQFLAYLIQDHDHLREKLMTEPDRAKRREKFEKLRPYLKFKADRLESYELAERLRANGLQPIYQEQKDIEQKRIWMPPSMIHEVPE
jgi:hypothetical protein